MVVLSDRTKDNGHKVRHGKFHTNMRNKLFTVRVAEHQNKLPREVVEFHPLKIFKTHLDNFLCSLM